MKGKLQINNITQKFDIHTDNKILPLIDKQQGWHWLHDGDEVDFRVVLKSTIDNSKCKCLNKSYEDTLTCKHFVGSGINDCLQIESNLHKVAALEWPKMTIEETASIDLFTLAFHKFASKYPYDGINDEEILTEFKKLNGLTKPIW